MNGGESLVETLIDHGVDTAFTVPGESFLTVLEALRQRQNRFRLITARQEGGAAFEAAGAVADCVFDRALGLAHEGSDGIGEGEDQDGNLEHEGVAVGQQVGEHDGGWIQVRTDRLAFDVVHRLELAQQDLHHRIARAAPNLPTTEPRAAADEPAAGPRKRA